MKRLVSIELACKRMLLALLLCAATAGCRTAPQMPEGAVQAPPQPPTAIASAAVGYVRKQQDLFMVPPTTTLDAVAPEGLAIEYYAKSPTRPVRYVGKARTDGTHYSFLWEVPDDMGPVISVWPWVGPAGDPAAPPPRTPVMKVQVAPEAKNTLSDFTGFPLFPAFNWHTSLSVTERAELVDWLGERAFNGVKGAAGGGQAVAYSGKLTDVSAIQVMEWTIAHARTEGWERVAPASTDKAWSFLTNHGGVKLQVDFAPEHGMLLRVMDPDR